MFTKLKNTIRYLKYNTDSNRMEMKARKVVNFGAKGAFKFFKDDKFRLLIDFNKKDGEEQNRFFNELVVTNIVLSMLLIDQSIKEVDEDDKVEYLKALRAAVPQYFKVFILNIGISENLVSIWEKLVDLRYDEYVNETNEVRGAFLKHDDEVLREHAMDYRLMIFQSIALGLYSHLVCGKIEKDSSLYKYIQVYLVGIYKGYRGRL